MYHKLETGWGRSGGPTSAWLGIDAPEKGQAFGDRAKESLSRLVFDRQIEAHCHKRDYYGREVCKVMHAAADVNLEQIRAGMAWWYREYAKERQDREDYAREEEGANAARSRAIEGCEAAVGVTDAAVPLIGRDARRKLCSAYRGGDGGARARRERLSSAQLQPLP
jgi:hypothetical protein